MRLRATNMGPSLLLGSTSILLSRGRSEASVSNSHQMTLGCEGGRGSPSAAPSFWLVREVWRGPREFQGCLWNLDRLTKKWTSFKGTEQKAVRTATVKTWSKQTQQSLALNCDNTKTFHFFAEEGPKQPPERIGCK